jgi:hypothetical protein
VSARQARCRSGSRTRSPTFRRPEPGQQLLHGERLDHVVVGAGVETGDPFADRSARGEEDDGHVDAVAAQRPAHLDAVHPGQHHIQQDRVQARVTSRGQSGGAVVTALGGVPGLGEVADDEVGEAGLVVDDQVVHGGQASRRRPRPPVPGSLHGLFM